MFRQPAWAVGSCSSGPLAARTVGTKSTGGCNRPEWSPCALPAAGGSKEPGLAHPRPSCFPERKTGIKQGAENFSCYKYVVSSYR